MNDEVMQPDAAALLAESRWIERLARRLTGDEEAAGDLAQGAWMAALTRAPGRLTSPRAWMATVLRSLLSNRRMSDAARRRRETAALRGGAGEATDRALERLELHQILVDHVLDLPRNQASVIVARYFEDMSPAEIAERSGEPLATVKSRLARGLETLRDRLENRYGGADAFRAALAPLGIGRTATVTHAASGALIAAGIVFFVAIGAGVAWFMRSHESEPTAIDRSTMADRAPTTNEATARRGDDEPRNESNESPRPSESQEAPVVVPATNETSRASTDGEVRVVDDQGRPAAGVPLVLLRRESTRRTGEMRIATDEKGTVRLRDTLDVIRADNRPETVLLALGFPARVQVLRELDLDSAVEERIDIVLPPCGSIDVKMSDHEGRPVAFPVKLTCFGVPNSGPLDAQSLSASIAAEGSTGNGRFRIERVGLDLRIRLRIEADDGSRESVEVDVDGPSATMRRIEADLAFGAPLPQVRGRIVREDGTPIAHLRVHCTPLGKNASPPRVMTTDGDGAFRMAGVAQGADGVLRDVRVMTGADDGAIGVRFEAAAANFSGAADRVRLVAGRTLVRGVVVKPDGMPLGGALIRANPGEGNGDSGLGLMADVRSAIFARTDAEGRFEIIGSTESQSIRVLVTHEEHADSTAVVTPGSETREFRVEPCVTARLRAKVDRRVDAGLLAAMVFPMAASNGFNASSTQMSSGARFDSAASGRVGAGGDGTIVLRKLQPGRYRVMIGTLTQPRLHEVPLTIEESAMGSTIDLGEIDLRGKLGSFDIRFVDLEGVPVAGREISVIAGGNGGTAGIQMRTDEAGRWETASMVRAKSAIKVSLTGFKAAEVDLSKRQQVVTLVPAIPITFRSKTLGAYAKGNWKLALAPATAKAIASLSRIAPSSTIFFNWPVPQIFVDEPGRYDVFLFQMDGFDFEPQPAKATIEIRPNADENIFDLDLTDGVRLVR